MVLYSGLVTTVDLDAFVLVVAFSVLEISWPDLLFPVRLSCVLIVEDVLLVSTLPG